jgi:hypothetical protein
MKIIEKISSTAYRLELPATWKIHNVFYVGLLKEYRGNPPTEPVEIPPLVHETQEFEVEDIRSHRSTRTGIEFLVKWKGYAEEENTWQTREDLANAPRVLAIYCMKAGIANEGSQILQDQEQQSEGTVEKQPPLQEEDTEPAAFKVPDQHRTEGGRPEEKEHEDIDITKSGESEGRTRRVPHKNKKWDDFVRF